MHASGRRRPGLQRRRIVWTVGVGVKERQVQTALKVP
jgi:hypothetical protein